MDFGAIVESIMAKPGPVRLVAIDGRGGAGKSTFAAQLAKAASGAPLLHTDDYAAAHEPTPWWPALLEQVIEPLVAGTVGIGLGTTESGGAARQVAIEPAPIVFIEGVSAGRSEWSEHLAFVIWIDTPTPERQRRMFARDGDEARDLWDDYEAEEDAHFTRDPTRARADLIIDGA